MQKLIDSISGIDLTAVQPEQLCRKHGTFRCNSTGSGRDKKYSYMFWCIQQSSPPLP